MKPNIIPELIRLTELQADMQRQLYQNCLAQIELLKRPASSAPSTCAKQRGPKMQHLFADANGRPDAERTRLEAERIKLFIADHRLGNSRLDCDHSNRLTLAITCFYRCWREHQWVPQQPQGAAIYRFLTEQCHIKCDVVPRSFTKTLCTLILRNTIDYDLSNLVKACF